MNIDTILHNLIIANIITWLTGLALYIYRTRIHTKDQHHARPTTRPHQRPIKTHPTADLTPEINAAQRAIDPHIPPTAPSPRDGEGWGGVIFPEVDA